jgi:hypothetical protein
MCWVWGANDDEFAMLGRRSLPLLVSGKKPGDTTDERIKAFGGSWFAVSPAGAKVAPRSQSQGGGE